MEQVIDRCPRCAGEVVFVTPAGEKWAYAICEACNHTIDTCECDHG